MIIDTSSVFSRGLSEQGKLKAEEELGESEKIKSEALAELRQLIEEEVSQDESSPINKYADVDDLRLLRFLRARKYNVESALQQIKAYETFIEKHNFFGLVDKEKVRHHVENCQPGFLPTRDQDGRAVLLFRIKDWDPAVYSFSEAVATYVYIIDKLLDSEDTQVNGLVIIEDFNGYSFRQMTGVGIYEYKQMIDMIQGSMPIRFKGVFCINQPTIFVQIFDLIKRFLGKKIRSRVKVYGKDHQKLFQHFTDDVIPSDFGGLAPPYDGKASANLIL